MKVEKWMHDEIIRLAEQYQFFHWHLAFPKVFGVAQSLEEAENQQAGWNGGFDAVLSNPPWEKIQIEEKLFFAGFDSDIAEASAAKRKKLIAELSEKSPELHREYLSAIQLVAGQTHMLRDSAQFPLAGKGNITTHSLFIELAMNITGNSSRIGLIVPSGLATQDTQKELFGSMIREGRLRKFYDFENSSGLFPGVHRSYKFCLSIIGPPREETQVEFAFYLNRVDDLSLSDRVFTLSSTLSLVKEGRINR